MTDVLCWQEVNYAVSIGYKVLNIFEVYAYKTKTNMFNRFYSLLALEKLKHSSPSENQSLEDYCAEINKLMNLPDNLALKPEDITPNKCVRNYAKEFLNSCLGKFSQQSNRSKTIVVRSRPELNHVHYTNSILDIFPFEKAVLVVIKDNSRVSKINLRAN